MIVTNNLIQKTVDFIERNDVRIKKNVLIQDPNDTYKENGARSLSRTIVPPGKSREIRKRNSSCDPKLEVTDDSKYKSNIKNTYLDSENIGLRYCPDEDTQNKEKTTTLLSKKRIKRNKDYQEKHLNLYSRDYRHGDAEKVFKDTQALMNVIFPYIKK